MDAGSRDDFIIAIRSAFLKKGNKQRFSLIFLIIFSLIFLALGRINFKPIDNVKIVIREIVYRSSFVVSIPENYLKKTYQTIKSHFIIYNDYFEIQSEIKELKELKKRKHICPQDIKRAGSHKYTGEALSAILAKPYYSDIPIIDVYSHWENISLRFAVPPKQQVNNPCKNE